MAGIWNINSVYNNTNTKMVSRKLSFEVGQNFLARVVNLDKLTGEILLKLLDGWQFSAKIQNSMEKLPEGLIRFEVEGFEDGNLQLRMVTSNNKQQTAEKDSINAFLKEKSMNLSDSDYDVLNKMVKHNISLTKENISDVKTILDFMGKIKSDTTEENSFVEKYIQSKNIDIQSKEGIQIKNTLKPFLNELKGLTEDDLFVFFENNIDLTEDNIKSFNNVFKGDSTIFKDVKYIEDKFKNVEDGNSDLENDNSVDNKKISEKEQSVNNTVDNKHISENMKKNSIEISSKQNDKLNSGTEVLKELNKQEDISQVETTNEKQEVSKDESLPNNTKNSKEIIKASIDKDVGGAQELKLNNNIKDKNILVDKHQAIEDISNNIKEQINIKTEELKDVVKTLLEPKSELDPKVYNNVMQALDKNFNDFKIFNSISNQYYYLDLPINVDKHEYQCKLIIKDERKKGKRIDSTDVKIAASVNTINMGVVDAYIKVNKYNMNLDIKCNEDWVKVLDKEKELILSKLSDMGYNVYANVSEREKEMNITNCSNFFGDNNLNAIDKKV